MSSLFRNESNPRPGGVEQIHSNVMSTFIYDLTVRMDNIYLDDFKCCPREELRSEIVCLACHPGNGDNGVHIHAVHLPLSYINHFISTCLSWSSHFRVGILLILMNHICFKYPKLSLWWYFLKACAIGPLYGTCLSCHSHQSCECDPILWLTVTLRPPQHTLKLSSQKWLFFHHNHHLQSFALCSKDISIHPSINNLLKILIQHLTNGRPWDVMILKTPFHSPRMNIRIRANVLA